MPSATFSITITAANPAAVRDDFCASLGYNSETDGTKIQFIQKKLGLYIKHQVASYRANNAANASRNTSLLADESDIVLS